MSKIEELRSRIVGTWAMTSLTVHLPNEPSKSQPFASPEGKGFLIYSNDGFMTALIHESDGSNVHSYSSLVSFSEEGDQIVISHLVKADVHVENIGTTQRRLPVLWEENGEEFMAITTDGPLVLNGKEMIVVVKWKRAKQVYKDAAQ